MRESAEFKISFASSSSSSPTKREREKERREQRVALRQKSKIPTGKNTHHREREKKVKTNFALKAAHLGNHRHPLTGKLTSESELFQRIRQRLISIHLVRACSLFKKKKSLLCPVVVLDGSERRARASSRITRGMRELQKKTVTPLCVCVCVCFFLSNELYGVTRVFFSALFSLFAANNSGRRLYEGKISLFSTFERREKNVHFGF